MLINVAGCLWGCFKSEFNAQASDSFFPEQPTSKGTVLPFEIMFWSYIIEVNNKNNALQFVKILTANNIFMSNKLSISENHTQSL